MHESAVSDANYTWFLLKNIVECDMMSPDTCENTGTIEDKQTNLKPETEERDCLCSMDCVRFC